MSRKFHKLVVVPLKTSTAQLYVIQQRLLSVINPELARSMGGSLPFGPTLGVVQADSGAQRAPIAAGQWPGRAHLSRPNATNGQAPLLPGHLIVEGQPLLVNCNISDEFVLRRLRESPHFQLAWYKNGKQLKGSMQLAPALPKVAANPAGGRPVVAASARIQFLQANGRQMYISSAVYSDAGEYLCSWSKLPISRQVGY